MKHMLEVLIAGISGLVLFIFIVNNWICEPLDLESEWTIVRMRKLIEGKGTINGISETDAR